MNLVEQKINFFKEFTPPVLIATKHNLLNEEKLQSMPLYVLSEDKLTKVNFADIDEAQKVIIPRNWEIEDLLLNMEIAELHDPRLMGTLVGIPASSVNFHFVANIFAKQGAEMPESFVVNYYGLQFICYNDTLEETKAELVEEYGKPIPENFIMEAK